MLLHEFTTRGPFRVSTLILLSRKSSSNDPSLHIKGTESLTLFHDRKVSQGDTYDASGESLRSEECICITYRRIYYRFKIEKRREITIVVFSFIYSWNKQARDLNEKKQVGRAVNKSIPGAISFLAAVTSFKLVMDNR